jgi:hypothetical protein
MFYSTISNEPLNVIEANECDAYPDIATKRFRRLFNELRNAQQSVRRIAFGAFSAGVLVGIVVALIIVFVQIGVR